MVLYRFKYNNRNNSAKFFKRLEKIASFHRHVMWRRAARTLYNKGYSMNQINKNISRKHNISYQLHLAYKLHLAQCIRLPTGETVCVIKTFWLRIIQRTWKKVFKERQRVLKNIYLRQRKGKVFMPSLTGMLWFYGV
jgi:ubiquinone/menaquinone biosynthesis C-methylase UbiE